MMQEVKVHAVVGWGEDKSRRVVVLEFPECAHVVNRNDAVQLALLTLKQASSLFQQRCGSLRASSRRRKRRLDLHPTLAEQGAIELPLATSVLQ